MELSEKNGHASIEEILASVRRIIAEEPGTALSLELVGDVERDVDHAVGDVEKEGAVLLVADPAQHIFLNEVLRIDRSHPLSRISR